MTLTAATLAANLDNPVWRLNNLYKITTKGDDPDDEGLVILFKPNRAQLRLMNRLHHRNVVLKARQMGITTFIAVLWLDTALFSKGPIRCGIIAHDKWAAEAIFANMVKFAYDNLPDVLRERMWLKRDNSTMLQFGHNGATIQVATSMRSGTTHRLHVSEFGKICARDPSKAREVIAGSIPSVPKSGITVIESTAEGQDGAFYDIVQRAVGLVEKRTPLSEKDYRFHFYPWWGAAEYAIDPENVVFTEANNKYFSDLEGLTQQKLTDRQRAWYVATLNSDFNGDAPTMWQEYPSTHKEAFQVSTEGCYYAEQLATARKQGRILPSLPQERVPVNTFWDLGRGDMTAIWFHQRIGPENRFIRYYEASGEELSHFAAYLQKTGYIFGRHYLPHDAAHKRLGETPDLNRSLEAMLQNLLPGQRFEVVPRVTHLLTGIQATRNMFASSWFDEAGCAQGITRLANYRKEWDKTRGCWRDTPLHDANSHGSDAFRQFGQVADAGGNFATTIAVPYHSGGSRLKRRGSPMAI